VHGVRPPSRFSYVLKFFCCHPGSCFVLPFSLRSLCCRGVFFRDLFGSVLSLIQSFKRYFFLPLLCLLSRGLSSPLSGGYFGSPFFWTWFLSNSHHFFPFFPSFFILTMVWASIALSPALSRHLFLFLPLLCSPVFPFFCHRSGSFFCTGCSSLVL